MLVSSLLAWLTLNISYTTLQYTIYHVASDRQLDRAGKHDEYTRARRAMTKHRSDEILGAVDTMVGLNDKNIPELMAVGLDFTGKLDTNEIHYMGHSFGGAAAMVAAHRRVPTSVIAHDVSTIPEECIGET